MANRSKKAARFEEKSRQRRSTLIGELFSWVLHNKKWWLLPILVVLLMLGALVVVGGSGIAPFLYTLF